MKTLWLHTVRTYLRIALFFYYRRIHVVNADLVPKKQPVLLLSNHNNALIDALLIATKSGRFSYFLTRASVFKKPMVEAFLKSLNMLPVYRIRDGWSSISNNNYIFKTCANLLSKQQAVALFPEGNHCMKRSVRNLSKGFTRIVFETMDKHPDTDLQIVPIGLNFEQGDAFGDSVSMYFGTPIAAKGYLSGDRSSETMHLKQDVSDRITQLTTHIPEKDYDATIDKLEALQANFLNPIAVNNCLASNLNDCTFETVTKPLVLKLFFKYVMIAALFVPYLIWKFYVEPKIKEIEFVATFRFAVAISLVPLWLLIVGTVLGLVFGSAVAGVYILSTIIVSLLAVKL